jgi:hypothetical protein
MTHMVVPAGEEDHTECVWDIYCIGTEGTMQYTSEFLCPSQAKEVSSNKFHSLVLSHMSSDF